MKIVAIIQARMGSNRLPGKVLKKINGKPLLEYQVERIKYSKYINQIVIATTSLLRDDPIVEFCNNLNLDVFRGSENDVLDRYYNTAKYFNADVVVRLTSDCPIIDPLVIDSVIEQYIKHKNTFGYVSNTLERSFPRGLDTEVFSFPVLKKAFEEATLEKDREHVTSYIYSNPTLFKLSGIVNEKDYSYHRWTVDTKEDFELISLILNIMYEENNIFYLKDVINLLEKNPKWLKINKHIEQKKM